VNGSINDMPFPDRDCILLSYLMPPELAAEIYSADPLPQAQTVNFAENLLGVLQAAFACVTFYGFAPIQDYPRGRIIFFGRRSFMSNGTLGYLLPFINLLILKHLTRLFALIWLLVSRRFRGKIVIVHGLHQPYLLFGLLAKFCGAFVGVMVTDEQGIAHVSDGAIRRVLKRIDGLFAQWATKKFDFCLSLSMGLGELYSDGPRQFVFPGIIGLTPNLSRRASKENFQLKTILYAGTLAEGYGVDLLAEAANFLPDDFEIRILGRGPLAEQINAASVICPRLKYLGFLDRQAVLSEMADCDLLINPRPSDSRLAALSAPSKLIEYAMSGRPVLTTRLPSITSEMSHALLYIDREDNTGVAKAIIDAFSLGSDELSRRGREYRNAIVRNYSSEIIGRRMRIFLEDVIKHRGRRDK